MLFTIRGLAKVSVSKLLLLALNNPPLAPPPVVEVTGKGDYFY